MDENAVWQLGLAPLWPEGRAETLWDAIASVAARVRLQKQRIAPYADLSPGMLISLSLRHLGTLLLLWGPPHGSYWL
jgi:hypothetical protein